MTETAIAEAPDATAEAMRAPLQPPLSPEAAYVLAMSAPSADVAILARVGPAYSDCKPLMTAGAQQALVDGWMREAQARTYQLTPYAAGPADSEPGQDEGKAAADTESAQVSEPGQKDITEDKHPAADESQAAADAKLAEWTARPDRPEPAPESDPAETSVIPSVLPAADDDTAVTS